MASEFWTGNRKIQTCLDRFTVLYNVPHDERLRDERLRDERPVTNVLVTKVLAPCTVNVQIPHFQIQDTLKNLTYLCHFLKVSLTQTVLYTKQNISFVLNVLA